MRAHRGAGFATEAADDLVDGRAGQPARSFARTIQVGEQRTGLGPTIRDPSGQGGRGRAGREIGAA